MFEFAADKINSLLFPRACLNCQVEQQNNFDGYACSGCWSETQIFDGTESLCEKCGSIIGSQRSLQETQCWKCSGLQFDKARACGVYSHALSASVIGLKSTPKISGRIGLLLKSTVETFKLNTATVIMPVPLSKRRLMERGFNQAEILARSLSHSLDIPIDTVSLQRRSHSLMHRAGMDAKARDLSVKDAFTAARPKLIVGQKVLLVDDVYTTGATVSYCAKALKKQGAARIYVVTLARTTDRR